MKTPTTYIQIISLISVLILGSGCSTVESHEWAGDPVMQGQGGIHVVEDGIEIWKWGSPERAFQPLMKCESSDYGYSNFKRRVKELGGDGFIVTKVTNNRPYSDGYYVGEYWNEEIRLGADERRVHVIVFKYL